MEFPPPKDKCILLFPGKEVKVKDQVFFQTGNDGLHQWESGIVLSRFLVHEGIQGRVLELGSGTGLAGISCAKFNNCESVTLTDYHSEVLENIAQNIDQNQVNASLAYLDWTDPQSYLNRKFNYVVGSDLVYDGAPIKELACCIKEHLETSGKCFIVMPDKRKMTQKFIEELENIGMLVESSALKEEFYYSSPNRETQEGYRDFRELTMHTYMLYTITT